MAQEKRLWFRFSPGDAEGVRVWLDELAKQGWELAETQDGDCFTALFRPTTRTELIYDVCPAPFLRDMDTVQAEVTRRQSEGWESVATINGMDIFRSIPLRYPRRKGGSEKERRGALLQRWLPSWLAMAAMAVLAAVTLTDGTGWLFSDLRLWLALTGIPAAILTVVLLLWRFLRLHHGKPASYAAMTARGVLGLMGRGWLVLTLAAAALRTTSAGAVLLVLVCWLVAMVSARGLWNRKDNLWYGQSAALITGLCALALFGLSIAYPAVEQVTFEAGHGAAQFQKAAVLHLTDLPDTEGALLAGACTTDGSLLVRRETYEEWWQVEGQRISLTTVTLDCHLGTLDAAETLLTHDHPNAALLHRGNRIVAAWTTLDIPKDTLETALRDKIN